MEEKMYCPKCGCKCEQNGDWYTCNVCGWEGSKEELLEEIDLLN